MKEILEPKLNYIGTSRDNRTNIWSFTCSCGKTQKLPTTMYFMSKMQCNKCGKEWSINYNDETFMEIYK